jgi:lipopolysaccharide export LptBFGC system permease protein LptF
MKKLILIMCLICVGVVVVNANNKKDINITSNIMVLNNISTKQNWKVLVKDDNSNIQEYINANGEKFRSNSKIIIKIDTMYVDTMDIENKYNLEFVRYMHIDENSSIKKALFKNSTTEDTANIINNISSDENIEIKSIMPDIIFNMTISLNN